MSDTPGTWSVETHDVDDPLKDCRKRPIISDAGPNATFVGRVIIEMWEDGSSLDDGQKLAIVPNAMDGKHAQFLERVAAALALRMQRGNPFR
jgi:hypothetical protein